MLKSIIIAIIVLVIGCAIVFFLIICWALFALWAACQGLSIRGQAITWAREYWKSMNHKAWQELTEEEQDNMVKAYAIVLEDCCYCGMTDDELREKLQKILPIDNHKTIESYFQESTN